MRSTLSKSEILRGYKSFTRVITVGKSIGASPIRCYYIRSAISPPRVLAGFTVSRSIRSAVDRNQAKRLMRESYRLNKYAMAEGIAKAGESLEIVFMYVGSQARISFKEIKPAMEKLIHIDFSTSGSKS